MGAVEPLIATFALLVSFAQALIVARQAISTTQVRMCANLCRVRAAPASALTSAIARRTQSASAPGDTAKEGSANSAAETEHVRR
jgi:hypothetical protein